MKHAMSPKRRFRIGARGQEWPIIRGAPFEAVDSH
jgi:hypothetical protein